MITTIVATLKASLWGTFLGRVLAAVLAGFVALKLYGLQQQHVGAQRLATKIEKKVEANVKATDAARARSRSGTGGVRDPYLRD